MGHKTRHLSESANLVVWMGALLLSLVAVVPAAAQVQQAAAFIDGMA